MTGTVFFRQTTSPRTGAIGMFHLFGDEAALAATFDATLSSIQYNNLKYNELRLIKFRAADGTIVDEALAAKLRDGIRILMCHGGKRIMERAAEVLGELGIVRIDRMPDGWNPLSNSNDDDAAVTEALSQSVTDEQVIAILTRRLQSRETGGKLCMDPEWLRVRRVVLVGPPNAGKSSLLNCLSGYDRAFVHAEAGATRDAVEELVEIAGRPVLLGDLPGFADAEDTPLADALEKAGKRLTEADLALFVCDSSAEWDAKHARAADTVARLLPSATPVIILLNRADLPSRLSGTPWREYFPEVGSTTVSALRPEAARKTIAATVRSLWGNLA
jgi:small GTP-binding protein